MYKLYNTHIHTYTHTYTYIIYTVYLIYQSNLLCVVCVPPKHDHMYLYVQYLREETNSQEVRVTGSSPPLRGKGSAAEPATNVLTGAAAGVVEVSYP